jgi:hypothetical protein
MTDYPVTKEELEQIRFGCDATKMMNEVLARPDPLTLLEAWRKWSVSNVKLSEMWVEETLIINEIRNRPEAVREQGIKEGWWKE